MKRLYYRSQIVSSTTLLAIAMSSIFAVVIVQRFPASVSDDLRMRMWEASYAAENSYNAIACKRAELGHRLLRKHDPARTGMLGPSMSLVTTLPGHLESKQTSVNPNFAAVAVAMLHEAGVQPGDAVAMGMTGSFPALDIAVIHACEAMDLRPLIVSSAASSQFGANEPEFMWPDMEKLLYEEGLISTRSLATSMGGFRDRAEGMTDDTRALLLDSINRSGVPALRTNGSTDSIDQRMGLFTASAAGQDIVAYINVGGGSSSVGGSEGNEILGEGVLWPKQIIHARDDKNQNITDCVALRFAQEGVPTLNFVRAVSLANRYQLDIASMVPIEVGRASVFYGGPPRRWLAGLLLCGLFLLIGLLMKPPAAAVNWLHRHGWLSPSDEQPQWMV
ncbi:MAG: poly-gamma-glutamate system protein [Planctomycetota bacterium]